MSTVKEKIQSRLMEPEQKERRQIALSIQEEKLIQLERIAKAMTEHSGQNVTRNMLIEDAIEAYIDEASGILTQGGLWSIPRELNEPFDTVVLPTNEDGFREVFLGERRWYYVKLDKKKIQLGESLKNFGNYEVAVKLHPQVTGKFTVKVTEA